MPVTSAISRAYDGIHDYIVRKGLQPGDRLPTEREFARFLGVSRTAVREAIREMTALGIVEGHPGRGTFLKRPVTPATSYVAVAISTDKEMLLALLEVRRAMEDLAVRLAAQRATDEELQAMERILDEFDEYVARGFNPSNPDWRFHMALYRASHNPVLTDIMQVLSGTLHRFWENPLEVPGFASRTHPLHRQIFERVRARDADGASRLVQQLLDIVEEDIRNA